MFDKINFNRWWLIGICFMFLCFGSCQEDTIDPIFTGAITGTILNSGQTPIPGVSITTNPPSTALLTDDQGAFSIPEVSVGDVLITAEKQGFVTNTVRVLVQKAEMNEITMVMVSEGDQTSNLFDVSRPLNQATGQPISITLSWSLSAPQDSATFDVILYESNSLEETLIAQNTADTLAKVEGLKYETTYFWQVLVKQGQQVEMGEIWSFQTQAPPNSMMLFSANTTGNYDVYSATVDGLLQSRLTFNQGREWYPRLNPQRDAIAYSSDEKIDPHIFIMNLDGSEKKQVTKIPIAGYHNSGIGFCWSPDGGSLLYSHYRTLYLINKDGTNLQAISQAPDGRHYRECDWTAQGEKIVALSIGENIYDSELHLMNADGSNPQPILGNLPGITASPNFSIDGQQILFTRDISGFESPEGRQLDSRVFLMDLNGSNLVDISHNKPAGTNDILPRFSTDGARIIFVNVSNDGLYPPAIWTMDVNGENRVKLMDNATMPN